MHISPPLRVFFSCCCSSCLVFGIIVCLHFPFNNTLDTRHVVSLLFTPVSRLL
eukprot:m.189897 g.189897  ORF g.189897 m.189897 type:complete len:53 (+) comp15436_c0_seq1:1548-1706(+)